MSTGVGAATVANWANQPESIFPPSNLNVENDTGLAEVLNPRSKSGANDQADPSSGRTPQRIVRSSCIPKYRFSLVPLICEAGTALKSGAGGVPLAPPKRCGLEPAHTIA